MNINETIKYQNGLPNFFVAGTQKCASTWLWKCLKEHPQIYVPEIDRLNFFTINYTKGLNWYKSFYVNYSSQKLVGDTTSYLKDPFAPARIYNFNPNAKIIFILRNPIDRAYSMYSHLKRKGKISYCFDDFTNRTGVGTYWLYNDWVLGGFYHYWLQAYYKLFSNEQIKIVLYDDLQSAPDKFISEIYQFLGADSSFVPNTLYKNVNSTPIISFKKRIKQKVKKMFFNSNSSEVEKMNPETRLELQKNF